MNTPSLFDWLSSKIAEHSGLDALKSRGTLRLALQNAGLEPRTLTKEQASVVVTRLLPHEFKLRGIAHAEAACTQINAALRVMAFASTPESAETAFARLSRK